jgi:hypothetical protein
MGVGLPGGLPLGVVELIAQRLVLGRQISDSLLDGTSFSRSANRLALLF